MLNRIYISDKRVRPTGGDLRKGITSTTSSASKSATGTMGKKGNDDAISAFLAPTASSRPARPLAKKVPAQNDALAQAFASIKPAQTRVEEPEPVRKSPDPSRPPRMGKNGQPRPHMTVRWKEGPGFTEFRMIEARDSNDVSLVGNDTSGDNTDANDPFRVTMVAQEPWRWPKVE